MDVSLPETYLIGLTVLLLIISILVGRQLLRTRRDEMDLITLEKGGIKSSKESGELYELASVQIRKRLYPQASATLKKALQNLDKEPSEAKALIENALGFSLAAQNDFKSAISHYKNAIKAKSDYPVALNNLGFAQQRLMNIDEAYEIYSKVIKIDPSNKTAKKEIKKLDRIKGANIDTSIDNKGF